MGINEILSSKSGQVKIIKEIINQTTKKAVPMGAKPSLILPITVDKGKAGLIGLAFKYLLKCHLARSVELFKTVVINDIFKTEKFELVYENLNEQLVARLQVIYKESIDRMNRYIMGEFETNEILKDVLNISEIDFIFKVQCSVDDVEQLIIYLKSDRNDEQKELKSLLDNVMNYSIFTNESFRCVINPRIGHGSVMFGHGAKPDLLIDGILYDIKTTSTDKPAAKDISTITCYVLASEISAINNCTNNDLSEPIIGGGFIRARFDESEELMYASDINYLKTQSKRIENLLEVL